MVKSFKSQSNSTRKSASTAVSEPKQSPSVPRPGGKLGLMLERLSAKTGATADELVEATGWQRHSVLGALSRLRARGFDMRFDSQADRKAYRLNSVGEAMRATTSEGVSHVGHS